MFKQTLAILLILSFIFLASSFAQEKTKSLSLEECILGALKNNLGVAVQVLNPEIADLSVSRAQEKFVPSLSFGYNKTNNNSASYSWIDAAESVITKYNDYSVQVSQLIPTGGSFSLSLDNYKNDSNRSFQTINPRYGSTLRFNFTQPLLKDFGFKTSRREIIIARNNLQISESQFEKTLLDTIYNVEEAYWNLVYSIQDLEVRRQSLKLAQDFLEKNQRSVEVGTLAPIEILSAQAEVATREADILQAEALVKSNEDRLKMIINLPQEEGKPNQEIAPVDKPSFEEKEVNLEQSLAVAMENRPDLQASRIGLKNYELDLSYARNQLLPGLNLTASYWSPGLSGDRILYENDNPLTGKVIGIISSGASNAIKDAFNFKYRNWAIGLTLDLPMSNVFTRAALAQAKVNMEQALLNFKNQEQQVYLEIKDAVRAVQTDFKRVSAYKVARDLAEKKLQAAEEKLKVGLSTNFEVLSYQRDVATARTSELKAIIDYNLSLASLDRALGTTLKAKNMKVTDFLKGSSL
jgi:outer membrane protein TolC